MVVVVRWYDRYNEEQRGDQPSMVWSITLSLERFQARIHDR